MEFGYFMIMCYANKPGPAEKKDPIAVAKADLNPKKVLLSVWCDKKGIL